MKFVLAGQNKKKLVEMRAILSGFGIEVISQSEAGVNVEVEETGSTFEDNAILKAKAVMQATGLPAVSDDSGLAVEALGGEPGVYSARYGGARAADDVQRYELLLENMKNVEQRGAKYVSCIAAVFPDGTTITAQGECEGSIAYEPRGDGGFGYDPIFELPDGRRMAEIDMEEKNKISHRAKALRSFEIKLKEHSKNVNR
jgi:XTP/dITP diphosphohydrolase